MAENADVVVIGGGVIGLSCAWRCAQAGLRVRLVEKEAVGSGASGASLGALIPSTSTFHGPTQSFQRASLWGFPEFAAELCECSGNDIRYERCGLLDILHSDQRRENAVKEVAVAVAEWPAFDDRCVMQIVENDDALAIEEAGLFDASGVRYCRASASVDVSLLLAALKEACVRRGVQIHEGAAVTEIVVEAGRAIGIGCREERIDAGVVVAAAGAWGPFICPALAQCAPVRPVKGQALLLDPGRRQLTHIIKRRRAYLLPLATGQVLVGSTTEPEAGFDLRTTGSGVAQLASGALGLMPRLAHAQLVRMWAGLRPESLEHRPFIGQVPDVKGFYVATGHYKTGIGMAPLTGQVIAASIMGGESGVDLAPFAPLPASGCG